MARGDLKVGQEMPLGTTLGPLDHRGGPTRLGDTLGAPGWHQVTSGWCRGHQPPRDDDRRGQRGQVTAGAAVAGDPTPGDGAVPRADPSLEPYPHQFATALFSFLYHLASYDAGGEALVSCGMMEALLKVGPATAAGAGGAPGTPPPHPPPPRVPKGHQVPGGRAGPDHLCDAGGAGGGPHHQPGHGRLPGPRRPLHLHLPPGGDARGAATAASPRGGGTGTGR